MKMESRSCLIRSSHRIVIVLLLLIQGSFESLVTGRTAVQSSSVPPVNPLDNTAVLANNKVFNGRSTLTELDGEPYAWWKVNFGSIQTVNSVLIIMTENCCQDRNYVKFTVGTSSLPYENDVCTYTTTESGWYTCTTTMIGNVFGVCQTMYK